MVKTGQAGAIRLCSTVGGRTRRRDASRSPRSPANQVANRVESLTPSLERQGSSSSARVLRERPDGLAWDPGRRGVSRTEEDQGDQGYQLRQGESRLSPMVTLHLAGRTMLHCMLTPLSRVGRPIRTSQFRRFLLPVVAVLPLVLVLVCLGSTWNPKPTQGENEGALAPNRSPRLASPFPV